MNIEVRRFEASALSIISEVLLDRQHECYGLEPPYRETGKPRAIPAGTYDITIRWSDRFQRLMPHVENVPDFSGILIHWGNYPRDTEGCLLVGRGYSKDWVSESRKAFDDLFMLLRESSDPITISYVDVQS